MSLGSYLKVPFLYQGKVDRPLLALFLAINLLVLTNSLLHNPEIGYDAVDHLRYVEVLPYRLPTSEDSQEFFSAPLPYFLPSIVDKACHRLNNAREVPAGIDDCLRNAGKSAQLINVILSLGVTFLIIKIAEVVRPGNRFLKISSLALLGVMTVYYKTFAQVRGEPYVVLFAVWAIYLLSKMVYKRESVTWQMGIGVGIVLGLLMLSRQWGVTLFPAILGLMGLVWIFDRTPSWRIGKTLLVSFIVALLISGWFYLYLYLEHGSFLAFNRSPQTFSLTNQPPSFYRGTGLKNFALFKSPIRDNFSNQFIPIFYSDTWGDYWGYFVIIKDHSGVNVEGNGNEEQITPYLGRVNAVAVLPSLILLAGMFTGVFHFAQLFRSDPEEKNRSFFYTFLLLFVAVSFLLFFYFLIVYPITAQGDTIKATYLLHALVVLPILGAEFLEQMRLRYPRSYLISLALLGLVFVHNLPAMITRYRVLFP